MKLFACGHCGQTIYFENIACERCGHRLGYWHETSQLLSLDPSETGGWIAPGLDGTAVTFCANSAHGACNWLVPAGAGEDAFCRACRHNELIPPMQDALSVGRWQVIERAKKRLVYALLRLRLPLATRAEDSVHGLSFRFLSEADSPVPVMTGHVGGVITIGLAEADDAQREYRRTQFNEPYRTLLGHFRHEVAHHYWDILVATTPGLAKFRALFGNETTPYEAALERYYAEGAPVDWQERHISAYAASHPWEDFAETWAHYMHLVDTLEMAAAFGLSTAPGVDEERLLHARIDADPYQAGRFEDLVDDWVPLAALINSLNRAVGQHDAYPFVLTKGVIEKLSFVHDLVRSAGAVQWSVPGPSGPIPINTPDQTS